MYYELVEKDIRNRNNFVLQSGIKSHNRDFEAYRSLYSYPEDVLEHVKLHGSIKDYSGECSLDILYFDIDCENDLKAASKSTIDLILRLNKEHRVHLNEMLIYFSGNKGFHLGLPNQLFGGFISDKTLPDRIKLLAKSLSDGIPHVDLKIYNKTRLFRLPNSLNKKSGLYKVQLSFDELKEVYKKGNFKEYSAKPRPSAALTKPRSEILLNDNAAELWQYFENLSDSDINKVERNTEDVKGFIFDPPGDGERNDSIFKQAALLFDKSELSFNQVLNLSKSINVASGDPIDEEEVYTTVRSAQRKTSSNPNKQNNSNPHGVTFAQAIPGWIDYISPAKQRHTLLIKDFDKDIRGKLGGKLVGIIGKGGTRKSLYSLLVVLENIKENNSRAIYSSMEMGNNPNMSRIIDNVVDFQGGSSSSSNELEILERDRPGVARKTLEDQVAPFLGNKLIMMDAGRMSVDGYDKAIEYHTRTGGKVHFLVVDSLSMMESKGDETTSYSINTAELKYLANKWDLCCLVMLHTARAVGGNVCTKHTRDSSRFVRGSEKILDNVDFYICASLCIDQEKGSQEEPEYLKDVGYLYYHNKRGTGETIKAIYEISKQQLEFVQVDQHPDYYEVDMHKMNGKGKNLDLTF